MRKINEGLYIIEGVGSANIFLLGDTQSYALIDTGIFKKTQTLIEQLETHGFAIAKLHTIVLTHCHCDHIGGVTELVKVSGARVAAHVDDVPYITQQAVISGPYHGMMIEEQKVMRRFACNVEEVDILLRDGDSIDSLGGLQVIRVPGHTPGSIALYQPDRKIMFFGDVIRNNPKHGLTVAIPEHFNVDTKQTINDARRLLDYPIECALFGHGEPLLKDAGRILTDRFGERDVLKVK